MRGSRDVCEKLEKLEQEYRRLTHTQINAEAKIRELECKLQEEEHHRKLIQDKAAQVLLLYCCLSTHNSISPALLLSSDWLLFSYRQASRPIVF